MHLAFPRVNEFAHAAGLTPSMPKKRMRRLQESVEYHVRINRFQLDNICTLVMLVSMDNAGILCYEHGITGMK